jgi:hypothetical protein
VLRFTLLFELFAFSFVLSALSCAEGKKKQAEHRTATTAYPCYLPILGEFSRSWSCRPAGGKDTTGIELFVQRGKIIR